MKKKLIKLWVIILLLFSSSFVFATTDNIKIDSENIWRYINNGILEDMKEWNEFFEVSTTWEQWIKNLFLNIARDLRTIVFILVSLVWIIMVIKLLFWDNTEEQQKNLKNWILWASVWIMVMQIAFSFYKIMFDKDINKVLWENFSEKIIEPFIDLLMLWASFIFIFVAIYAFYHIITAWWNEENIKQWKTTIFQAIIWFIVIKFANTIVKNTFNTDCSWWSIIVYWWNNVCNNITENAKIITSLINWVNSFIVIVVVIMIIYAGFLIMTWAWEEDKQKKAKNIILYVWIGLLILVANYLILTFFIIPEITI